LANEVPYNLEESFRQQARTTLAAFQQHTGAEEQPSNEAGTIFATKGGPTKNRLLRWLSGGAP
jgi:hypothetical protein